MGAGKKVKSTLVGLKYPTGRDDILKTGVKWLNGKREDDGAEGLWRVGDKLYDLDAWARNHPGGTEWITFTRGTDITEAFEANHISLLAERLLPKFYIRDAAAPRSCPLTFEPDGFYRTFKARAREALKDVDFHRSSRTSNLIADSLFATTIGLCLAAAITQSWIAIVASGMFLCWTSVAAHNFFHQRDSFRMCYFDLTFMSSKEWRITHALSHHLYTNTVLDIEITLFEPFLSWLPDPDKEFIPRFASWIYSPVVYTAIVFQQGLKRIYSTFFEWDTLDMRDAAPFLIPALMCSVASPFTALWTWLRIMLVASFHFGLIGVHAAHHHPDIYHDGDAHREDNDWGLAQLDAVRDRVEIETSIFLVLTHFGTHSLHHLLPTVDHAYLPLCEPAFQKTCQEFQVDTSLWTQWKLFKGQFMQLANNRPKKTPSTR
ncbi:cytochrome b5-related protein-like [Athalia rosae]|uniref:cytochrome b5-related protein-like n=1 Tax=Athalia rosae TaxID=37344 RepID=UPI0020341C79|nr:cytochrome b5-related protein-like [Athalia rosae]XP_048508137.1 cytochrome b5-related protein-like [Athalia rosae]